jgi:hypothetical protein
MFTRPDNDLVPSVSIGGAVSSWRPARADLTTPVMQGTPEQSGLLVRLGTLLCQAEVKVTRKIRQTQVGDGKACLFDS